MNELKAGWYVGRWKKRREMYDEVWLTEKQAAGDSGVTHRWLKKYGQCLQPRARAWWMKEVEHPTQGGLIPNFTRFRMIASGRDQKLDAVTWTKRNRSGSIRAQP